ncbi:hypothetical protein OH77DRAFT_1593645 [Trametes cingulata]|nr:hypothetical protein OH77DRAFT_1593645 [Trametes cingulata]
MPDFFRPIAGPGTQGLVLRAASNFFRSLHNLIGSTADPSPEPEWTPHVNALPWSASESSDAEDYSPSRVSEADGGTVPDALDLECVSDTDVASEDEQEVEHANAAEDENQARTGEQLEGGLVLQEALSEVAENDLAPVDDVPEAVASPASHPHRDPTVAPASPSTSNSSAHLDDYPVRNDDDSLRAPSPSSGESSPGPSTPRSSSTAESSESSSSPSRDGRKRSRGPDDDHDGSHSDAEVISSDRHPPTRRPRKRRRRVSLPPPVCTRETCLARNLHLLGNDNLRSPQSDNEDTWSNTAQPPSDTEREPIPELSILAQARSAHRRQLKRARGDDDPGEGPSSKRRKRDET